MNSKLTLSEMQIAQINRQLAMHDRGDVKTSIHLLANHFLDLIVDRGVFAADIMSSSIYLARYLSRRALSLNPSPIALDMGCGTGLQGLILAYNLSDEVDFADMSERAIENARKNVELHGHYFEERETVPKFNFYVSDLFEKIPKGRLYDLIVFNHPFFPEKPKNFNHPTADNQLKASMLGGTNLLARFFQEAKNYLSPYGAIIMPYFHLAGIENDPINCTRYGYRAVDVEKIDSTEGLQKGDFSIYGIKRN